MSKTLEEHFEKIENMTPSERKAYKDKLYENEEIDKIDKIDNMTTDMEHDQAIAFKDGYYAREEEEEQDENFSKMEPSYRIGFKKGYSMENTNDFKETMKIMGNIPNEEKIGFKDGIEAKKKDNFRDNKLNDKRYYDAYYKGYDSYIKKKGGRKRKYKKTAKKGGKKKSRNQKKSRKARR